MNLFKTERLDLKHQIKEINTLLEISILRIMLIRGKKRQIIINKKDEYLKQYNMYGDCIDATMNIIDFIQHKVLTEKQIDEINKAIPLYIMPPVFIEDINKINKNYNTGYECDEIQYTIMYYNRLKNILLNLALSESELDILNEKLFEDLEKIKVRKNI